MSKATEAMFFPYLDKQVAWFSFHVNYSGLTRRWKLLFSRKKRILVVDDEVGIGKLIQRLIESEDLEVELAHSAEQARQLFYKNHFPVVLLDLDLPDACGIQLLQEFKAKRPRSLYIVMTGLSTTRTAVKAIQLGAYDFLEKPFDNISALKKLIKEALQFYLEKFEHVPVRPGWEELARRHRFIVGKSPEMQRLVATAYKAAAKDISILIQGETGSGKEVLARFVHAASNRSRKPFVAVNCGALSENLLESELFGHEKGAFTDSVSRKRGIFELADGGTLFLDEIGEASQSLQVKLLRVLENGEFMRIGGEEFIKTNVRVIAATNVDLQERVKDKTFREDLLYRLEVVNLTLPPLRTRPGDIPELVDFFLRKYAQQEGRQVLQISPICLRILQSYHWPGNVRELAKAIEQVVALCEDPVIMPRHMIGLLLHKKPDGHQPERLPENEKEESMDNLVSAPVRYLQACLAKDIDWDHLPPEQLLLANKLARTLSHHLERVLAKRKLAEEEAPGLKDLEGRFIAETLRYYSHNISLTARALGIARSTLYRKIKKYSLQKGV